MNFIPVKKSFKDYLTALLGTQKGIASFNRWRQHKKSLLTHTDLLGLWYSFIGLLLRHNIPIKKYYFSAGGNEEQVEINHQKLHDKSNEISRSGGEFSDLDINNHEHMCELYIKEMNFSLLIHSPASDPPIPFLLKNTLQVKLDKIKKHMKEHSVDIQYKRDFYYKVLLPVIPEDFNEENNLESILNSRNFLFYWKFFKPDGFLETPSS